MSIYPDKDRQGNLTGAYRVEVQLKNHRIRGKFWTLPEAQEADTRFREELLSREAHPQAISRSPDKREVPKTLGALFDKAKDSLWRGKTTEPQSLQRCMAAIAILGASTPLRSLSIDHMDGLVADLLADHAPATVNRYLSTLHVLLKWGKDRKYLSSLPQFSWQSEEEGRIRWLTESEEETLYKLLPPKIAMVVKVAVVTGMRRNELLGLDKTTVEPAWVRLWITKTKVSRSVPINPETYELLQALLNDGMPTMHQLRYAWDTAKEAMGLTHDPLFVFHACRHTCATRLVRANVNIRVIQRWLGHKRIETTLRYAHVNDEMLVGALGALSPKVSHKDAGNILMFPTSLSEVNTGDTQTQRQLKVTASNQ